MVMGVTDAPCAATPIGKYRGKKARDQSVILDFTDDENFQSEDRTGDGGAKNTDRCLNAIIFKGELS